MPEMVASEMLGKTPSSCTPSGHAEFKENISRRHHELELVSFYHKKSFARLTAHCTWLLNTWLGEHCFPEAVTREMKEMFAYLQVQGYFCQTLMHQFIRVYFWETGEK